MTKQLEEVRAERDELAVAERVFHRISEQLELAADEMVKICWLLSHRVETAAGLSESGNLATR
ncbi:hypothetical protein J7E88_02700 [Streptomyces sp. ISL-10]|uniref:hypothetical protein n=1 Tax=Streptomyces sp. ISL-10 TaxID=2819172 RepID=UPI001BEA9AE2|nr:hypothetical protein [Streptomyces sp. ISL-10]MBT2364267.1 hypothetical protein [Streptomyces sp. ISL-10]